MAAHSKIGASSYYRWSKTHGGCPGSVKMSEGIVSPESAYAAEGTRAHDEAAELLVNGGNSTNPAIQVYLDYVREEFRSQDSVVEVEKRFDLGEIYPGLFGTADCVIYFPEITTLKVIDFKYGAGIAVDAENNLQAMYYALGALLSMRVPCDTIEVVIVQPRAGGDPIKSWEFSSAKIIEFAADLKADAAATEDPNAALNPGDHCRFCPAAATKCPALKQLANTAAQTKFTKVGDYDAQKLSQAVAAIPALKAWIKQVSEFAYREAAHGRLPPGFKLVAKRNTRKWSASEDQIVEYMATATKRNKEEFYNHSLKTPAQMEKLVSKQLGTVLRTMIKSESSGYNLVPESDSRPAVAIGPETVFQIEEFKDDET